VDDLERVTHAGSVRPLVRFVEAQDLAGTFVAAVAELRAGRKVTHWMWFVFPQLAGLGSSEMATTYALDSVEEAQAYLAHPLLSDRLHTTTGLVLALADREMEMVFGRLDSVKLRSSMTLFEVAAPEDPLFAEVLDRCFAGARDPKTIELLQSRSA